MRSRPRKARRSVAAAAVVVAEDAVSATLRGTPQLTPQPRLLKGA
jgi:hypothetical protein